MILNPRACMCVCFQDLAQSVNEVKRDNEIIKQITTFQLSIENMVRLHYFIFNESVFGCCLYFLSAHPPSCPPSSDSVSSSLRSSQNRWRAKDLQLREKIETGQVRVWLTHVSSDMLQAVV